MSLNANSPIQKTSLPSLTLLPSSLPIQRILIANRGEIANRIIRTCKRLGIETVLAASKADLDSLPARLADRTICIGPARSTDSYLNIATLVQAALGVGAQAIHPGYGFLSERAEFAAACEASSIIFIGPTAAQIERVGDKLQARLCAIEANVPVVPGGPVESLADALVQARNIGYPVLIKAVGGGGGRGLKRADTPEQLEALFDLASAEALAAFGDGRVFVECYVTHGRHVEVQILGDGQSVIHLGDRDCSVQRRYQKLIEEAPAPGLAAEMRRDLHASAVRFSKHIAYRSLGTVEFLVDIERKAFYFLEMNARIQVEHPVTEGITGLDLVEQQIAVAQGELLRFTQADIEQKIQAKLQDNLHPIGHAMECRLNAEDPAADFRPSPGTVTHVNFPVLPGLRYDTHVEAGARIPPYYDSMVAKVIAHGANREEARQRLLGALNEIRVEGVRTNLTLHRAVLAHPEFVAGGMDTGFLARFLSETSLDGIN
jgi:acetyl-CoA carboxylase, biotin carboxylase subunit